MTMMYFRRQEDTRDRRDKPGTLRLNRTDAIESKQNGGVLSALERSTRTTGRSNLQREGTIGRERLGHLAGRFDACGPERAAGCGLDRVDLGAGCAAGARI